MANGGNGSAARTLRATTVERLVAQSCRVRALAVAVTGKLRETAAEAGRLRASAEASLGDL